MCWRLDVATPLTLSEVRAMLPAGLAADSLSRTESAPLRRLFPEAQTVVRLRRGNCACDFLYERDTARGDEAALRARAAILGLSRNAVIRVLDEHRRGAAEHPKPRAHWARALAAFVAEHARNAGPTVYLLHFTAPDDPGAPAAGPVVTVPLARVLDDPDDWLAPDVPLLVVR